MIIEFILLGIISNSFSQSIHHLMTPEERMQFFGTSLANKVPVYDTVPIVARSLNRNNGIYITLKPFGENLKMWLTPKDGILAGEDMPIYSVKTIENPGSVSVTKYVGYMKQALPILYENTLHAASFAVNNHDDGKKSMTGFVGDLNIQPIPSRLMEHARQRRAANNTFDKESDDHIYHFVHKIPNSRFKRQAGLTLEDHSQEIVYPEILIILDYNWAVKFNKKMKEALLYILSFWNGVDMRYRNIENPRIRLNIAGIVFPEDPKALAYLRSQEGKIKSTPDAFEAKGKFLYQFNKFAPVNSYDIAVTMTPNSLCDYGGCDTLGQVANIGKACDINHQKKTMKRVMIIRDKGGFDGIETASHELGHMLGMHHDGSVNGRCSDDDGYIMAPYNRFSKHAFDWSKCSLDNLFRFLRSPKASCLYNKPNQGKPIYRFLPGQLMTAHGQCKLLNAIKASKIDESICTQLKCQFPDNDILKYTNLIPEAAEGTTCGVGKLCLHGHCVFKTQVNK